MRRPFLLLLPIFFACDDPIAPRGQPDPCETEGACEVEGMDLEVRSLTLVTTGTHPSGLRLVPGDTVHATVVVRNRGSVPSVDASLSVQLNPSPAVLLGTLYTEVPALTPGEERPVSVAVPIDPAQFYRLRDERIRVRASVFSLADTIDANNAMTSDTVVVTAALLQVTVDFGEGRAGGTLPATVTIRNRSTTTDRPAREVDACLYDTFRACDADGRSRTGAFTLPAVPAGATVTANLAIPIPPEAVHLDQAASYETYVCPVGAVNIELGGVDCTLFGFPRVRPDYEGLCAPPALTATPVTLATWNCGNPHLPRTARRPPPFHLLALDAAGGATYRIERSTDGSALRLYDVDGEPVPDLDPAPDRVRVGTSERIYIVSYSAGQSATFAAIGLMQGVTP